jgi:hypothetical protein
MRPADRRGNRRATASGSGHCSAQEQVCRPDRSVGQGSAVVMVDCRSSPEMEEGPVEDQNAGAPAADSVGHYYKDVDGVPAAAAAAVGGTAVTVPVARWMQSAAGSGSTHSPGRGLPAVDAEEGSRCDLAEAVGEGGNAACRTCPTLRTTWYGCGRLDRTEEGGRRTSWSESGPAEEQHRRYWRRQHL